jgi:hypothetical protein
MLALLAKMALKLALFIPLFVLITALRLLGHEAAATELTDWWLHL